MTISQQQKIMIEQLDFCINKAKKQGVDEVEAFAHSSKGTDIEVRMAKVEKLEFFQDRSLSLTVYADNKKASVSTTDFSESSLSNLIDKACSIVKYTEMDKCNGLVDKSLLAFDYPDLDLYHPWDIKPSDIIEKLCAAEEKGLSQDKRLTNSDGVSFSSSDTLHAYANSHDFIGHYATSNHSYACCLVAKENDQMQREFDYTVNRVPSHLMNFDEVALKAGEKAINMLGAKSIKTLKAPVIFIAHQAKGILGNFLSAISGSNLYTESSFLLASLQKKVFNENINITEDPHLLQGLASSPFDADGVKLKKRKIIDDGILQGYLLSNYSAKRLKMQTTGNAGGAHNILVEDHGLDFSALVKKMHRGLIITEMMGHGVNLVTGNYSRGAAGFWVENGEIVYPVQEITVAGNLKDMLMGIKAVSNDIDKRGKIQTGSILIDQMTIAGN